ncbi:MAG TPA: integrase core domain-containing protein [Buttiauxella sp.]
MGTAHGIASSHGRSGIVGYPPRPVTSQTGWGRTLEQLIEWKGKPVAIRCDNGPEYTGKILMSWAAQQNITLRFIQPGKPQQNAYIERYNRTVRYDWLGQHLFTSLDELQDYATRWQWFYNHERPNMALDGLTPMQHIQRMG